MEGMNGKDAEKPPGRLNRMAEWLDGKLTPTLGPPPVGPYGDEPEGADKKCPVCGHPMDEHRIDHSTTNAVLICPVEPLPVEQSHEPLNEVGMPKRGDPSS